jgi:5-methylcytosine-specific restriction endonuclease McrA
MGIVERIIRALPTLSKRISPFMRKTVLERYNNKCAGNIPGVQCNCDIPDCLEIDHILPKSIKRVDRVFSLQVLCSNCHAIKTKRYDVPLIQKYKLGKIGLIQLKRHIRRFLK